MKKRLKRKTILNLIIITIFIVGCFNQLQAAPQTQTEPSPISYSGSIYIYPSTFKTDTGINFSIPAWSISLAGQKDKWIGSVDYTFGSGSSQGIDLQISDWEVKFKYPFFFKKGGTTLQENLYLALAYKSLKLDAATGTISNIGVSDGAGAGLEFIPSLKEPLPIQISIYYYPSLSGLNVITYDLSLKRRVRAGYNTTLGYKGQTLKNTGITTFKGFYGGATYSF